MYDFKNLIDTIKGAINDYAAYDFQSIDSLEFINDDDDTDAPPKLGKAFKVVLRSLSAYAGDDETEDFYSGLVEVDVLFFLNTANEKHVENIKHCVQAIKDLSGFNWSSTDLDNAEAFFPEFTVYERKGYAIVTFSNINFKITI